MKMIYEYTSYSPDESEREDWTRIIDDEVGQKNQDAISPIHKNPAAYCAKYYLSDYPIIEFICASRGRKLVSINHCYKNKYFIAFGNREQTIQIISNEPYDWEDCIKLAEKYRNLCFETLKKILMKSEHFYIKEK